MSRESPRRLGRGLAALIGDARAADADDIDVRPIPVGDIYPNPDQARTAIAPEALSELAESLRQQGMLQPILVRPRPDSLTGFQIVAGERRWRAATLADLAFVPCVVQPLSDQQAAAASIVENVQRVDLNAMEEAAGFQRLMEMFGTTQDELAQALGKSRSHVANTLRLLRLPTEVGEMVRAGQITAGHARSLLSHADPLTAARRIVADNLSVRDAEAMADLPNSSESPARGEPDLDTEALATELSDRLGMRVRIRANRGRGSLTVVFSTLDQLDHLVARLDGPRL